MKHVPLFSLMALSLAGCGSNASTGIADIPLVPDLRATDVDFDPRTAILGASLRADVTIANSGGVDAKGFDTRAQLYYVFSHPACGAPRLVSEHVTRLPVGLGASQAVVVAFDFHLPDEVISTGCGADPHYDGSWFLRIHVDDEDDNDEDAPDFDGEGNNVRDFSFSASIAGSV